MESEFAWAEPPHGAQQLNWRRRCIKLVHFSNHGTLPRHQSHAGLIDFDYVITLLTVRAKNAEGGIDTHFCEPVGHVQVNGDYVERWQPQPMSATALRNPGASAVIYGGLDAKGVVFDGR